LLLIWCSLNPGSPINVFKVKIFAGEQTTNGFEAAEVAKRKVADPGLRMEKKRRQVGH